MEYKLLSQAGVGGRVGGTKSRVGEFSGQGFLEICKPGQQAFGNLTGLQTNAVGIFVCLLACFTQSESPFMHRLCLNSTHPRHGRNPSSLLSLRSSQECLRWMRMPEKNGCYVLHNHRSARFPTPFASNMLRELARIWGKWHNNQP